MQQNQDFDDLEARLNALKSLDSPVTKNVQRKASLETFAMQEEKEEAKKSDEEEEDLPLLDDILNKFNVDGLFEVQHKDLIKPFLTEESRKSLDDILAKN